MRSHLDLFGLYVVGMTGRATRVELLRTRRSHAYRRVAVRSRDEQLTSTSKRQIEARVWDALTSARKDDDALHGIDDLHFTIGVERFDARGSAAGLDLAVAVQVLVHAGVIPAGAVQGMMLYGQLGPDGSVLATPGVASAVREAARLRARSIIIPATGSDYTVPCVLGDASVPTFSIRTIGDLIEKLGAQLPLTQVVHVNRAEPVVPVSDLADVSADHPAREVIELSAMGRHGVVITGATGSAAYQVAGMILRVMPAMSPSEQADVACAVSAASRDESWVAGRRPLRVPDRGSSAERMVGDPHVQQAVPSEVTLAQHGILLMDDVTQFRPFVLDKTIEAIARGHCFGSAPMPAKVMVVASIGRCPCGGVQGVMYDECACSAQVIAHHTAQASRVVQALADAGLVDLQLDLSRSMHDRWSHSESSSQVRQRIEQATTRRAAREQATVRPAARGAQAGQAQAQAAVPRLDRTTRIAWTVADLLGAPDPDAGCLAVAGRHAVVGSVVGSTG